MSKLVSSILNSRWAMEREALQRMLGVVDRWASGEKASKSLLEDCRQQREARKAASPVVMGGNQEPHETGPSVVGDIGILPVTGVIADHSALVTDISGPQGTSTTQISDWARAFATDPKVKGVLLYVDSPGGAIAGMCEATAALRELRGQKPLIAYIPSQGSSCACWAAAMANEIYAAPIAVTGSVGIYRVVEDSSAAFEKSGVRRMVIASGKHKGVGERGVPITQDQLEQLTAETQSLGLVMKREITDGRGGKVSPDAPWMDGRGLSASMALAVGMIDSVGLQGDALSRVRELALAGRNRHTGRTAPGAHTMTLDELKAQHADLLASYKAQCLAEAEQTPATAAALKAAFPGDDNRLFRAECLEEGMSMPAARDHYALTLREQRDQAVKERDELKAKIDRGADPVRFTPDPSGGKPAGANNGGSGPADYAAAVKMIEAQDKVSRPVAQYRAAKKYPALHQAWMADLCPAIV